MIGKVFAALLLLCSLAVPGGGPGIDGRGGARVLAEERVGPRQVDLTVESPALDKTVKVRLLTPDGWSGRSRPDRWPVLYLLHGMGDDHTSWTSDSDVASLPALRDVLVVMPDAEMGWYTDWWNSGAGGPPRWETFHLFELLPLLEARYGAGSRRAVAGLSMGGYGALAYAARHPGMFRAVASYSGVGHLLHPAFVGMFAGTEPEALRLWGSPEAQRANWAAHDPYVLARSLRRTPVYLGCGTGEPGPLDPPGTEADPLESSLLATNQSLASRLRALDAPVTTHFTAGTHSPAYWERELHRSLPMLLRALG